MISGPVLQQIIYTALLVLMIFYFSINTVYLFILFLSVVEIRRSKKYRFTFDIDQAFRFRLLPPVSIILPAYNEEKSIVESVRSILFVRYPQYELLVVNDGSKDGTLQRLIEAFNLIKTDYVFRRSIDTEKVRGIYVSKDFKNIISPAGMATGDYILRDPLSLTPLALTKMKQFQLDDNFMLYQSAIFTLDRKNLLFFLDPAFPSSNTRENLKLIQLIDKTLAD